MSTVESTQLCKGSKSRMTSRQSSSKKLQSWLTADLHGCLLCLQPLTHSSEKEANDGCSYTDWLAAYYVTDHLRLRPLTTDFRAQTSAGTWWTTTTAVCFFLGWRDGPNTRNRKFSFFSYLLMAFFKYCCSHLVSGLMQTSLLFFSLALQGRNPNSKLCVFC